MNETEKKNEMLDDASLDSVSGGAKGGAPVFEYLCLVTTCGFHKSTTDILDACPKCGATLGSGYFTRRNHLRT